ncbi:MAG: ABC transporter ATP-binding protein [bacterium]|nr:ABC transporter ATP-binding protein [bacterium]
MELRKPLVRLAGVTREYAERNGPPIVALDGVDLEVPAGEFLGIIGPSGQGKSTLLNIMAGIDFPSRGRVFFRGTELPQEENERIREYRARHVSLVFQELNLVSHLNALQNAALPLVCRGEDNSTSIAHARAHLESLGLARELTRKPAKLSGGQKQRVAIARALTSDAELVLADEPTGSLDPKTSVDVMDAFAGLIRAGGRTVVLVTHNEGLAERYCTRIVECTTAGLREVRRVRTEAPERAVAAGRGKKSPRNPRNPRNPRDKVGS